MSTIIPASIVSLRVIRYDVVDGSVNDALTIHTEKADNYTAEEWADLVTDAWENPRHYVARTVGLSAEVVVDNAGDFGERVEFTDGSGDPVGALIFDKA